MKSLLRFQNFSWKSNLINWAMFSFLLLLTSCFQGKFKFHMLSKKEAIQEFDAKKFKLNFYDPAADRVFCPNIQGIFTSNTPDDASQYCLSDSSDPNQNCDWKNLPLDLKFKATTEGQSLKKYLLFRDKDSQVLADLWESNELQVKPTKIAKNETDRVRQLQTDELTEDQMDEYLCRMDEWSWVVVKNIAMNVSDCFSKERRITMSKQLARMYFDDYGFTPKLSKDEISKAGWRLIVHTQDPVQFNLLEHSRFDGSGYSQIYLPESLIGMDVSFINFKKRNLTYLNFKGTNLRGEQLNEIDSLSYRFSVSELDLSKWKPAAVKNIEGVDFSYTTNPPWTTINQATTLDYLNLSGLDLSNWIPPTTYTSAKNLTLSYARNIPFDRINAMTTLSYKDTNFSYTDLRGWQPATTVSLWDINLNYASNVPWTYINANAHVNGFGGMLLNGLELSAWTPASNKDVSGIDFKNATNIPWTYLNANTFGQGFHKANFEGLDLSSFSPQVTSTLKGAGFQNAKNINWTAINANSHADGYQYVNFNGLNLTNWTPSTSKNVGVSLVGSSNIPWDLINTNVSTSFLGGMDLRGQDLSKWSPTPSQWLGAIDLRNATNIPWDKINLNANILGMRYVKFSGLDLKNWSPTIPIDLLGADVSSAKNIPWDKLNANTNVQGFSNFNFSNLDLSQWKPGSTTRIEGCILNNSTNIPWNYINQSSASNGFQNMRFEKIDMSSFKPLTFSSNLPNFAKARNISWSAIVDSQTSTTHNFSITVTQLPYYSSSFSRIPNLDGFIPKYGYTIYPPYGNYSVFDFEEATEATAFKGVRWGVDNSYPWGF